MRWRPSRAVGGVLAWGAGAVTAIAVGVLALSLIGSSLVDRRLPPTTMRLDPAGSASSPSIVPTIDPAPTAVERTLTTAAGSVVARCANGHAYLVSWSPAQGYRAENVRRGPAQTARVEFESRSEAAVLRVTCAGGTPQVAVGHDDEHDH
ncbi:MAG: hypothetical protein HOV77_06710 [Hamadaea sp.]|uniref:hypothetical protein n=1 Tax=Hamadaea sp. TaxID=2024425 RepID=UPI0018213E41|nr:hypothetical protein [Hamadaea sp.]NUT18858.1 hypothetical protein [Hamadaea sp.]